jgi:drug/metabolite transporter (DMT)-like permease
VSTYAFVNPVIAVLLGTILRGEPFSRTMRLGAGLLVVSAIVIWRAEHTSSQQTNDATGRRGRHLSLRKT